MPIYGCDIENSAGKVLYYCVVTAKNHKQAAMLARRKLTVVVSDKDGYVSRHKIK